MENNMHQSRDDKFIPMTSFSSGKGKEVREDVYYYTNQIVNFAMVGTAQHWVLVDAGMPKSGDEIISVAENRFGKGNKPAAIVLTHGHFDHIGGIVKLVEEWAVPVYAHTLEFPFLTGQESYAEPDASVEGGVLAKISSIYPHEPANISGALRSLPADGSVPEMEGWRWIHTPGHTPGHVSLFRDSDRTLIAGDAFITVKQDSFYKVLVQKAEVQGPPRYLTTDWTSARLSVKKLEALKPQLAITGHGPAMEGRELNDGLSRLVQEFDRIALPDHGKYVKDRDKTTDS
ncbi:beta-lactamase-like protein [Flammeovirgaceae bacterium 311]|nr:beta-lactamase-like protein [Flammeovirgaceae bacterium 311]